VISRIIAIIAETTGKTLMLNKIFNSTAKNAAIPDGQRIYAIGDIHGCADLLSALLDKIHADTESRGLNDAVFSKDTPPQSTVSTRLIFLGDYIDRGPDAKGVLDRLVELKKSRAGCIFLKGNHEAAILDFLAAPDDMAQWLEWGGVETLQSYGVNARLGRANEALAADLKEAMPAGHLSFLQNLTLTFEIGDYIFVHAGLRPGVALEDQQEEDLLWIRKRFHQASAKERPEQTVIHGHHPVDKPQDAGWRINVDTGAVWSGQLTAVVLEGKERRFVST